MRYKLLYIIGYIAVTLACAGCSEHEVVTSYEEVKQTILDRVPLSFTPYVGTNSTEEATTRADLNYLTNVTLWRDDINRNMGIEVFNEFPWYNEEDGIGSATGEFIYRGNDKEPYKPNFRFGSPETNSYIVGIYGYYDHNWAADTAIPWSTLKEDPNVAANFMTNQPLKHQKNLDTDILYWTYSPLRYWPNSTFTDSDKNGVEDSENNLVNVSFISYYPFQDFEGDFHHANLECIEPPAKNATGKDAYTFTFTQKENIKEHVDFLLGINVDENDRRLTSTGINLNLRHTLCAVAFDFRTSTDFKQTPQPQIIINSVSLEGLYGKGKVYPSWEDNKVAINWELIGNDNAGYTFSFDFDEDEELQDNFNHRYDESGINFGEFKRGAATERLSRWTIYNNISYKSLDKYNTGVSPNSRGMKYLMLVIPQKAEKDKDNNDKDAYLVINYDLTYTTSDPNIPKVVYKNCEEKIKLKDNILQGTTKNDQLFKAGKFLCMNIQIRSPKAIEMDAVVETEWGDDLERSVTLPEPKEISVEDFRFSKTSQIAYSAEDPEPSTYPTLINTKNLAVTYKSTNLAVATVNETTGAVTIVGNGTTYIQAIFAGNDDYNPKTVSYTLTVEMADPEP